MIRGAIGLEVIDPDFLASMKIPSGLTAGRLHMAARALRFAGEELISALGGGGVEAAARWFRGRQPKLINVQRWKLW